MRTLYVSFALIAICPFVASCVFPVAPPESVSTTTTSTPPPTGSPSPFSINANNFESLISNLGSGGENIFEDSCSYCTPCNVEIKSVATPSDYSTESNPFTLKISGPSIESIRVLHSQNSESNSSILSSFLIDGTSAATEITLAAGTHHFQAFVKATNGPAVMCDLNDVVIEEPAPPPSSEPEPTDTSEPTSASCTVEITSDTGSSAFTTESNPFTLKVNSPSLSTVTAEHIQNSDAPTILNAFIINGTSATTPITLAAGTHHFKAFVQATDGTSVTCELNDVGIAPAPPTPAPEPEPPAPTPAPSCGDNILQASTGEQCDDGNTTDGDSCSSACTTEPPPEEPPPPPPPAEPEPTPPPAPFCGDWIIQNEIGESCDDGNAISNDGCSEMCVPETCGDGVTQFGLQENCDDGNTINGDGCSSACTTEPPPEEPPPPPPPAEPEPTPPPAPFCGDWIIQYEIGESCDDGNPLSNDGCSEMCVPETCGDGVTQFGLQESCDDGNTINGDGCSNSCKTEEQVTP